MEQETASALGKGRVEDGARLSPGRVGRIEEVVEPLVVTRLQEVAQLVGDHGVKAGCGERGELGVDGDDGGSHVARAPSRPHVTDAPAAARHAQSVLKGRKAGGELARERPCEPSPSKVTRQVSVVISGRKRKQQLVARAPGAWRGRIANDPDGKHLVEKPDLAAILPSGCLAIAGRILSLPLGTYPTFLGGDERIHIQQIPTRTGALTTTLPSARTRRLTRFTPPRCRVYRTWPPWRSVTTISARRMAFTSLSATFCLAIWLQVAAPSSRVVDKRG